MKRLLLLLCCATLLHAAHPPEWLQLPEPAAPRPTNASAWVLHDSERVSQESEHTYLHRYRHAVMPLNDAGVQALACSLDFTAGAEKVRSARAWAMSPDGRQCRSFGGDQFLIYSPTINNWVWDLSKSVLFQPQRFMQAGWIFAWEVEIESTQTAFDLFWSPRTDLPVKYASLELVPLPGGSVQWKAFSSDLPAPETRERGALFWKLVDLPGYDKNIPERVSHNSMELRAYLLGLTGAEGNSKSWGDVVRLARAEMDPKGVLTPTLEQEARRHPGTGNLWSKIAPLCRFVQKEVVYLNVTIDTDSMAGYRPHPATDVCTNRYGDCKDKAVLLCTMLRVLDVEAHVMLVNSGLPKTNRPDWPSAAFNHAIVALYCAEPPPAGWTTVTVEGRQYALFDPTNEDVPLGLLPDYDAGGEGLVLADGVEHPALIPAVPSVRDSAAITIRTTLTDDGSATIEADEERSGLSAAGWISIDQTEPRSERTSTLEQWLQRRVPLISNLEWESASDTATNLWTRKTRFSARYFGKRTSTSMYVATDLMSALPSLEPWEGEHEGWFSFAPKSTSRSIILTPPAGWEFAEAPADWSTKTAAGEGSMRYSQESGVMHAEIKVRLAGGVFDRDAYVALRDLVDSAAAAERRPLVLRRVAAAPAQAPAPSAPAATATKA